MAAKAKAPAKAKVKPAAKKAPSATAKPQGLQLTASQWNAYNKAFSATATALRTKMSLQAAARGNRKYQLQAANSTVHRYQGFYGRAQAAAVAANASRMTWKQSRLAHQNSALMNRIEQNMYHHANLLGRAQFAQAGVKSYAHSAVMRTVNQSQAVAAETAYYRKVSKAARKAAASATKFKGGPNSPAITRAASAAGLAAARRTSPKAVTPKARSTATAVRAKATRKAPSAAAKATQKAAPKAVSKKAPAKTAKARTAPMHSATWTAAYKKAAKQAGKTGWHGDEVTPNCVIAAVANHLLAAKGISPDEASVRELEEACPAQPAIEEVLWEVWLTHWPRNSLVHLRNYRPADSPAEGASYVVGYKAETDDGPADHAALSLAGGKVVSWGKVRKCEAAFEEVWELTWEA